VIPLSWFLAFRMLRQQRAQTLLMIAGVGVGVGVSVFISALINGLQQNLLDTTLSAQAHVVVQPAEERARPVFPRDANTAVMRRIQRPEQRTRAIAEWRKVDDTVASVPGVVATAPSAVGAGIALRGNASFPVVVMGIDPVKFDRVIATEKNVIEGRYSLQSGEVVIGKLLATNLGISVGDRLRVQTAGGGDEIALVSGLLDMGNQQLNERWVVMSLRAGQTLLGLEGGVSLIYVDIDDIFAAQQRAAVLHDITGLDIDDWMSTNQQLLTGLKGQAQSTNIIRFCVMFAVAISIASVLVVSVVQRGREIGILRAMGVPARTMGVVFVMQGTVVGIAGWLFGLACAGSLVKLFVVIAQRPDGSPLFPIILDLHLALSAGLLSVAIGAVAALFPARRAASLEPAVAIRHV
jgi:lipoprotein-releasing system permease protein